MSALLPAQTTIGDLITQALKDAGALGIGQVPNAEEITDGWIRLQWMLQEWERERWLVYHLVTYLVTCTGAVTYTIGPGGNIPTGGTAGVPASARPNRLEAAFLRQITQPAPNQVDYALRLLESMEDYSKITLKQLGSLAQCIFYDPAWPLGVLYPWPVPQANLYQLGVVVREQLPVAFLTLATVVSLPYEYYSAIVSNLALRCRPKYGLGTYPGDMVPVMAKNSLAVLRKGNTAIAELQMPSQLRRQGLYNVFSDTNY